MKYLLPFFIFVMIISFSCSPQQIGQRLFKSQFKGKYASYLESDEKEIKSQFHYVESVSKNGKYIRRFFFPETMQITSELRYSDKAMRVLEGPAKLWHESGYLKEEGIYRSNKKDGVWKRYHRWSKNVKEKGIYTYGQKTGQWESFDKEGRLRMNWICKNDEKDGPFEKYDSLSNVVSKGTFKADTIYEQIYLGSEVREGQMSKKERMPCLAECKDIVDDAERRDCSNTQMLRYIYSHLKYPRYAREYGIQGTVISQFVVDKDGSLQDVDVVVGICQGFKDEVEQVIKGMPAWVAGEQDGKKVKVLYTLPINFKLR